MEGLLVESAVRGAVLAAGVAAVVWVARIRTPVVLHGVWTGVVIAMLLLPLWTVWGPDAPMPVLPPRSAPVGAVVARLPVALAGVDATPPEARSTRLETATAVRGAAWNWGALALTLYLLVAGALLVRLASGTWRARRLVRQSVSCAGRLTSVACASPVTVGWFRPVIILPEAWWNWPHEKLDAVLTHEHEHARRRHPLVQWLALLNRALFWFHPVAWWLERRLTALAEQTCDDAVLARGHDPRDYAEYLLETAHTVGRAGRVQLAGVFMPGSHLPQRIRRMLSEPPTPGISRVRVACAVVGCAMTAALCLAGTPVRAASQLADSPSRMVFRPLQPRWIPPESTRPQPVSLEWLDGDEWTFQVQSIITSEELAAYGRLRTSQQRDAFIARFWASRDPSPDTPGNEFRDEYIRRVQAAIERFGASGQAGFGFDTDRGRVYLMLGAPDAIDGEGTGGARFETWRYASVAGIGEDVRVGFSIGRAYCGYRILSPAPTKAMEAATTERPGDEPVRHASVQIYPLGLTTVTIPMDAARVAGARYELHDGTGVQVDKGEIGSVDDAGNGGPLSRHLPPAWLEQGLGCTHALPAGRYTLSTDVRFVTGHLQRETVTFDVD